MPNHNHKRPQRSKSSRKFYRVTSDDGSIVRTVKSRSDAHRAGSVSAFVRPNRREVIQ